MNSDEPESSSEEQSESTRHPQLTLLQAFGLVILLFVLQLLISSLFKMVNHPAFGTTHWFGLSISHLISGLATAKAGAILAGFSLIALFFGPRFQPILLLPLAVVSFGVVIVANELGNLLHWISPVPQEYIQLMNRLFEQNFLGVFFTIGIVAPLVEELIFRGVVLDGLQIRYSTKTAVIASSIFFGLAHVFPWHAVVNAFLLGFFFSWIKLQTGSLRLCIVAHALYNSIPLIMSRLLPNDIPQFHVIPTETVQFQPLWLNAVGVAVLILGVAGMRALYVREPELTQ
jgi:membrane protease YdiL (CAAX protease family)